MFFAYLHFQVSHKCQEIHGHVMSNGLFKYSDAICKVHTSNKYLETTMYVFTFVLIFANVVITIVSIILDEGKPIDATQEMLALGVCNVVSAFVSSMPVSGGLSRGAVNHSSGVKTTLGGIYTGLLVLVSLQFLTPYLYFIPNAALAAIIIAAVIFMVELHVIKPIWRTKSTLYY